MARVVLAVGAVIWLLAGGGALALGLVGAAWLMAQLPPLAIDVAALGGAVVAIGVALVALAVVHAGIAIGLHTGRHWALAGGVLLCATLSMGFIGLTAAAVTTLMRGSPSPIVLASAGAVAAIGAATYAWCTVRLAGTMRLNGSGRDL